MQETASPETKPLAFNAVRQFVVSPDRYYRVELRRGALHFARNGTQFDLAHTGSVGRHQMKSEAQPATPAASAIAQWGAKASRGKLLAAGAGTILLSGLLIGIALAAGWVIGYLFVFFVFGFVLLGAGFVTPSEAEISAKSRDFTLSLSRIQSATLHLPKEAGKVAHLELKPLSDKPIKLTLNSPADLETVRETFLPVLGRKAKTV